MKFSFGHNIPTYNVLLVVSVVLGMGLIAFDFLSPVPTVAQAQKDHAAKTKQLNSEIMLAEKELKDAEPKVREAVFSGTLETVSPSIMSQVTNQSRLKGLKVISFRPQRSEEVEGLIAQPFIMSVEGSFIACAELVRDLTRQTDRLTVSQVQIASSDSESSNVSMTVEITAFIMVPNSEEEADGKA